MKAKELFLKATSNEEYTDHYAQEYLGDMYYKGHGVEKSFEEAFKWYSIESERGSDRSAFMLGRMHLLGQHAERSVEKAKECFKKALAMTEVKKLIAEIKERWIRSGTANDGTMVGEKQRLRGKGLEFLNNGEETTMVSKRQTNHHSSIVPVVPGGCC